MKNRMATPDREQMFVRACLESAPGDNKLGTMTFGGASEDQGCTQLHHLKQKVLYAALRTTPPAVHKRLCGAANAAAELAWDTEAPLVVFQQLFEEMTSSLRNPADAATPEDRSVEPDASLRRNRLSTVRTLVAAGLAIAFGAVGLSGVVFKFIF